MHGSTERERYPNEVDLKIRHCTTDDAAAIATFVSRLATEHIACSLGDGGLDALLTSMTPSATRQRLVDGWPHMGAFDGNDLAGIVVVKPPTHLYHLFVRTDLQRTGLGRKLMMIADDWSLRTAGVPLATVNASLNTVVVYDRLEFASDGPIVDNDGVRYQPMVRRKDR